MENNREDNSEQNEDDMLQNFVRRMDEFEKRQSERITKMTIRDIKSDPIFKAHSKEIYQNAFDMFNRGGVKKPQAGQRRQPSQSTAINISDSLQTIEFQVNYETKFGQEVYIIGSPAGLGSWDASGKALKLKWSNGHLWTATIPISALIGQNSGPPGTIEYKFVIKEGPLRVVRWEEGKNHQLCYSDIISQFNDSLKAQGINSIQQVPHSLELPQIRPLNDRFKALTPSKTLQIYAFWHSE